MWQQIWGEGSSVLILTAKIFKVKIRWSYHKNKSDLLFLRQSVRELARVKLNYTSCRPRSTGKPAHFVSAFNCLGQCTSNRHHTGYCSEELAICFPAAAVAVANVSTHFVYPPRRAGEAEIAGDGLLVTYPLLNGFHVWLRPTCYHHAVIHGAVHISWFFNDKCHLQFSQTCRLMKTVAVTDIEDASANVFLHRQHKFLSADMSGRCVDS